MQKLNTTNKAFDPVIFSKFPHNIDDTAKEIKLDQYLGVFNDTAPVSKPLLLLFFDLLTNLKVYNSQIEVATTGGQDITPPLMPLSFSSIIESLLSTGYIVCYNISLYFSSYVDKIKG